MDCGKGECVDGTFYISEITDEIWERIRGISFRDDCVLPREDLRYLHVLHRDISGREHEGEMIVNYHIAEDVLDILRALYEAAYPIERIRLVDEYGADDEQSMRANNSSSFNFRYISYTKIVDGKRSIEPATGEPYLDREAEFDYKIVKDDLCCRLFAEHGFDWGGDWVGKKDYQHFDLPDQKVAEWYPEFFNME